MAAATPEDREAITARARAEVIDDRHGPSTQLWFFVQRGELAEAARYVLRRPAKIDGSRYESLPKLADALTAEHPLAASVVYRALLEANLRKALTKYYSHGVRYWRSLADLAPRITDWQDLPSHDAYTAALRTAHIRKNAFWSRVDEV